MEPAPDPTLARPNGPHTSCVGGHAVGPVAGPADEDDDTADSSGCSVGGPSPKKPLVSTERPYPNPGAVCPAAPWPPAAVGDGPPACNCAEAGL